MASHGWLVNRKSDREVDLKLDGTGVVSDVEVQRRSAKVSFVCLFFIDSDLWFAARLTCCSPSFAQLPTRPWACLLFFLLALLVLWPRALTHLSSASFLGPFD